jgi:FAD/FMN-containing dehydrogenase
LPHQHTAKQYLYAVHNLTTVTCVAASLQRFFSQIGSLPAYQGLTLAGILATSAHGSGDMTTSSLADVVLAVTWVDGRGRVCVSRPKDPEFKAFNGGVGVFGVVTELLLQMTPPTNTQLITVVKEDKNMMEEINRLLKVRAESFWQEYDWQTRGYHWAAGAGRIQNTAALLCSSALQQLRM